MSKRYKILIIVGALFILSLTNFVTFRAGINYDFLVPGNLRVTNESVPSEGFESAERIVNNFIRVNELPGASVAIAVDGRLVYARGFGYSNPWEHTPMQPYNRLRIASISKLITAAAIMKLQEEGKLTVNDRVFGHGGILNDPGYLNPVDKRFFDITVAHLLAHQGGWTQRWGDQMFISNVISEEMELEGPPSQEDIIHFVMNRRLHFKPGTSRSYSNLGYMILGLVVEKASGMQYDEYCRKKLFEPIGVYDIRLGKNLLSQKGPFEAIYIEQADAQLRPSIYGNGEMVPGCYGGSDFEALGGAGAWTATAIDLLRFVNTLDGNPYPEDILSGESIRFMTEMKNGFAPVGWKATLPDGTWWRTGSFAGTSGMIKKERDGITWAILFNGSSWRGPELASDVNRMMGRVIRTVKVWPDTDLFRNSLPVPLKDDELYERE